MPKRVKQVKQRKGATKRRVNNLRKDLSSRGFKRERDGGDLRTAKTVTGVPVLGFCTAAVEGLLDSDTESEESVECHLKGESDSRGIDTKKGGRGGGIDTKKGGGTDIEKGGETDTKKGGVGKRGDGGGLGTKKRGGGGIDEGRGIGSKKRGRGGGIDGGGIGTKKRGGGINSDVTTVRTRLLG